MVIVNINIEKNTDAFIQGDIISITEKIDGANSSIYYDKKLDRLRCFSSKNELDFSNQLRGFLIYVKSLDMGPFIKYPNYIFFGEWLVSHTVFYDESNYNKWYFFQVSVYHRQPRLVSLVFESQYNVSFYSPLFIHIYNHWLPKQYHIQWLLST